MFLMLSYKDSELIRGLDADDAMRNRPSTKLSRFVHVALRNGRFYKLGVLFLENLKQPLHFVVSC